MLSQCERGRNEVMTLKDMRILIPKPRGGNGHRFASYADVHQLPVTAGF